jgi:hypothetical protein
VISPLIAGRSTAVTISLERFALLRAHFKI